MWLTAGSGGTEAVTSAASWWGVGTGFVAGGGVGDQYRRLGVDLCLGRVRTDEGLGFRVDVSECEDSEDCVRQLQGRTRQNFLNKLRSLKND